MTTMGVATRSTGDLVKRLRRERRWTAQRLAEECTRAGVPSLTRGTIAKIESGVRKSVTSEELVALAQALGVALTDLVDPGEGRPPLTRPGRLGPGTGEGIVVVSIGGSAIRKSVEAWLPELSLEGAKFVGEYVHEGYIGPEDFKSLAPELRDHIRNWGEDVEISRLHLFYRGPVAFGPLLGVLLASSRPLAVYHLENGRRFLAYVIDRKFMLSTS